jgi:hypothetical protein
MGKMELTLPPPTTKVAAPWDQAIVTLEPSKRHCAAHTGAHGQVPSGGADGNPDEPLRICLAHDDGQARDARYFVEQRYGEMGYFCSPSGAPRNRPASITLLAYYGPRVVGTLTLGFDMGLGLVADEQYRSEVDELRARGGIVAEITKLAIDTKISSKRLLAALFNVGYLYLRKVWRCTDLVIEVTPAHAAFYMRSLQFRKIGAARVCPRVNVEGVLLGLDLLQTQRTVAEVAGKADSTRPNRSLYTYFFAQAQEARVIARLLRAEPGLRLR